MWIGLFLVIAGVLAILSNLHIIEGDIWEYLWPLFFILLGGSLIWKHRRRDRNRPGEFDDQSHTRP